MLSNISWQQYFLFVVIITFLYYLFIWVIFFKAKIPLLSGLGTFRQFSMHGEDQPDEVMSTAQHIIDELKPVFENRYNKNELILALQLKLTKYNQWDEPGFRETINEFVAQESEVKCSIRLGEEDQRVLWIG